MTPLRSIRISDDELLLQTDHRIGGERRCGGHPWAVAQVRQRLARCWHALSDRLTYASTTTATVAANAAANTSSTTSSAAALAAAAWVAHVVHDPVGLGDAEVCLRATQIEVTTHGAARKRRGLPMLENPTARRKEVCPGCV